MADNATQQKRQKVATTSSLPTTLSPAEAAKHQLSSSLSSLHPTLRKFLEDPIRDILQQLFVWHHQYDLLSKMKNGDTIPASARFKFTLKGTPSTSKTAAFQDCLTRANNAVETLQQTLRSIIIEAKELDVNQQYLDICVKTSQLCLDFTDGYSIYTGEPIPITQQRLISRDFVLLPSFINSLGHKAVDEDTIVKTIYSTLDIDNPYSKISDKFSTTKQDIHKILTSCVISCFNTYRETRSQQERIKQCEALHLEKKTLASTTAASMVVDDNNNINEETILEHVNKAVDKRTKILQQKINNLQHQLQQQKNSERGAKAKTNRTPTKNDGAPSKKKSTRKAEGNNNASTVGKKEPSKKTSGKKKNSSKGKNTKTGPTSKKASKVG